MGPFMGLWRHPQGPLTCTILLVGGALSIVLFMTDSQAVSSPAHISPSLLGPSRSNKQLSLGQNPYRSGCLLLHPLDPCHSHTSVTRQAVEIQVLPLLPSPAPACVSCAHQPPAHLQTPGATSGSPRTLAMLYFSALGWACECLQLHQHHWEVSCQLPSYRSLRFL